MQLLTIPFPRCCKEILSEEMKLHPQLCKQAEILREVLFDVQAGNSNLAKRLSEKSNHAMYQEEDPHRGLQSFQNYQN